MMPIELLQTLSLISYVAAGLLLLISIALFFILDIRKVVGDISGVTARKAIENIRQQNEASGNKAYKPSPINAERGRLTDKITESGRLVPQFKSIGGSPGTEKIETFNLDSQANETTVLNAISGETTLLQPNEMSVSETTVLHTTAQELQIDEATDGQYDFLIEFEMGFTGSSEIIE